MPKTSSAVAQACAQVEVQPGCTGSWYDLGGELMSVEVPTMTRTTGSAAVFNDDEHVIAAGKKEPITITVRGVFTSVVTEAFLRVLGVWETTGCRKLLCLRWSPEGGAIGDLEFRMLEPNAELVGFQYPSVDASSGDPTLFEFQIYGYIRRDTIAS